MTGAVTVLRDKFVRGWPRHEHGAAASVLTLNQALTNFYTTDAHFAAYVTPNRRRLTREALDQGVHVVMKVIAFDVDCPSVHGTVEVAPDAWRVELLAQVGKLATHHPDPFVYMTRGGARVVYQQNEPTVLRTHDDAQLWSQHYAVCIAYLKRCAGIVVDPACADWQRLYRLPHATREHGRAPEERLTAGDASRVGTLVFEASPDDIIAARVASKAFRERRSTIFTTSSGAGDGLLYHLLRARGAIIREHVDGSYVIRCPRDDAHTKGSSGDGSTLLYPPAHGKQVGAIHCMHGHCSNMSVRDWLRVFSQHEIEVARRAAGVARVA
jgi:hypothetical protein